MAITVYTYQQLQENVDLYTLVSTSLAFENVDKSKSLFT